MFPTPRTPQTVNTRKTLRRSILDLLTSRARFAAIFVAQNRLFEAGILPALPPFVFRQFGCPCQKQPWTKIAHFARRFDRSGRPGNVAEFALVRCPRLLTILPTFTSISVCRCRTACIISRRFRGVTTSAHMANPLDASEAPPPPHYMNRRSFSRAWIHDIEKGRQRAASAPTMALAALADSASARPILHR